MATISEFSNMQDPGQDRIILIFQTGLCVGLNEVEKPDTVVTLGFINCPEKATFPHYNLLFSSVNVKSDIKVCPVCDGCLQPTVYSPTG